MNHSETLRKRLLNKQIVVAPGVYDAFTASLAEKSGFEALYLSGASIAYTQFARPDIGLVGMSEVAEVLARVRERVEIPVIADADTGFGNALNTQRTVRVFEQSGASCIQIEDQTLPKRCGHLQGKTLVSVAEMAGKIKAACDARRVASTLIMARTDAIAVEGFDAALERAERYLEAGCDILFVEAVRTEEQMRGVVRVFGDRVPLLANMVEGGMTPFLPARDLEAIGYSIAIFPGGLVRALAHMAGGYFASLRDHGTTSPWKDRMLDLAGLNDLLETAKLLENGARYDAEKFGK